MPAPRGVAVADMAVKQIAADADKLARELNSAYGVITAYDGRRLALLIKRLAEEMARPCS